MARKEDLNPKAQETEEEYLSRLREAVETGLQQHFGKLGNGIVDGFADSLSTYPERVNPKVDQWSLRYQCTMMSLELQQSLDLLGIITEPHGSITLPFSAGHVFLVPTESTYDLIIDPSVGQFIVGHNHVFVGTRVELRRLVLESIPERFFERIWGSQSQSVSQFLPPRFNSPGLYYSLMSQEPVETTPPPLASE